MKMSKAIIYLLIMGFIGTVYNIYCIFTGYKKPCTEYTPFREYLKKNNDKLYYVVESYKSKDNSLTQKLSFYLPMDNNFRNVTLQVFSECKQPDFGNVIYRHKLYWELTDFDTIRMIQCIQNVFNKVKLVRIDKDVVNC